MKYARNKEALEQKMKCARNISLSIFCPHTDKSRQNIDKRTDSLDFSQSFFLPTDLATPPEREELKLSNDIRVCMPTPTRN